MIVSSVRPASGLADVESGCHSLLAAISRMLARDGMGGVTGGWLSDSLRSLPNGCAEGKLEILVGGVEDEVVGLSAPCDRDEVAALIEIDLDLSHRL